jgi:hypothetical protein
MPKPNLNPDPGKEVTMSRFVLPLLPLVLLGGGCLPLQLFDPTAPSAETATVPQSTFGTPVGMAAPTHVAWKPGTNESALKVSALGQKITAANPQLGLRPLFATIGSDRTEVFHQRAEIGQQNAVVIYITEGLLHQCKTEGQLAALLCHELGKVISEREVLSGPRPGDPERLPPVEVPIGNAGQGTAPDQTHLAEVARFERERPRPARRLPAPDPKVLARIYLKNARYAESELDAAAPLLRAADAQCTLEKQFTHPAPAPTPAP